MDRDRLDFVPNEPVIWTRRGYTQKSVKKYNAVFLESLNENQARIKVAGVWFGKNRNIRTVYKKFLSKA